ncbi:BaiN/RdsA family NAD(P)/FAD-dependent oxidoreductase [Lutispora saccharofermentans]|uniref:NAD(P)/FAD-dependent oxidoreductase n=1 Tax=Lutispora saccharofermentans TaxID=3024236 RepID=A0ABT1NFW1_9FIRM|nr:NAD(P)/FAD-dependent oxidoreductase [Lutispora saccharofermentans]MCQ1530150.1 NAD(P)/FAD-dependent oxidoreductase [Lutispora saccharofermentans]
MNKLRIVVVGGGASGMLAAIVAARNGAHVSVAEQLPRVGKKLLATGNGRCNLTNTYMDIESFHGSKRAFAHAALAQFDQRAAMNFFEDLGIHCVEEDGGKVFPASGQASSVLDVLRYEMESLGVQEICDARAEAISHGKKGFNLKLKDKDAIRADKVILAAGGKANPGLGSNGSGYALAKTFGHRIVEPFPALVKLKLEAPYLKALSGAKITGEAAVESEGRILRRERGEILFTDYGVSGPPVIQLSRCTGEQLRNGKKVNIILDLFPHMALDALESLLERRTSLRQAKPFDFSFIGLINKRFINVLLKEAGVAALSMPCGDISREQVKAAAHKLKRWVIPISGTQSWSEAQVTAGGIDVSDIDPKTMESRLQPGLYFSGEIMDIDGDCGGFNLQWAWSSGYAAGYNASKDTVLQY